MKTIKLISRWNDQSLTLRISNEAYGKLRKLQYPDDQHESDDAILLINEDLDRVHYGYKPRYISEYQAQRVARFFGKDNVNYFSRVEF